MPLTQEDIDEYKALYREQYGKDVSDKDAWEQAQNLINLFRLLLESEAEDLQRQAESASGQTAALASSPSAEGPVAEKRRNTQ